MILHYGFCISFCAVYAAQRYPESARDDSRLRCITIPERRQQMLILRGETEDIPVPVFQ